jgi:hypothetical protein
MTGESQYADEHAEQPRRRGGDAALPPRDRRDSPSKSEREVRYQIVRSVYCRRCSYDLRLLAADGRCPECGLDIWPSIMHVVDPAASKLPQLRDPRGVGNALVWLIGCAVLATAMLALSGLLMQILPPGGAKVFMFTLPLDLTLISGLIALAGLLAVFKFMPPRGALPDVAVRRDLWLLAVALIGWAIVAIGLWNRERAWLLLGMLPDADDVIAVRSLTHFSIAIAAILGLRCLRNVLETIGRRSREYRRAQGSRQGVKPMMVGSLGVAVGSMIRYLGTFDFMDQRAMTIGTIIVWVSMVMLVIGLSYLLINAWWIREALRRPPPRLVELLRPVPEAPATIAPPGSESNDAATEGRSPAD